MGSRPIQLLTQFSVPISRNFTAGRARRWQCFSGDRSGGSRWEWHKKANPNLGSRFSDTYATNEYDEEDGFRFRNTAKQRVWWSDDLYAEDDEEEDEGFGVLEASIGFNWVFKVVYEVECFLLYFFPLLMLSYDNTFLLTTRTCVHVH